ncbi:hypothetical protein IJ380_00740 [Candidatus Saccharibacteria bacterium]|nr:hypothetical protein [Candidatus Saccharibacteria bacterium]
MTILETLAPWILYFFVYALAGYFIEVTLCSFAEKKVVNRGFLFGPLIPIYGFGVIFILLVTAPFKDDLGLTFLAATALCSILEYVTSWAMEKIFGIKWWDYTKSDRFNLNGRICLRNCLAFGIAGVMIVKYVHPLVVRALAPLPEKFSLILAIVLVVLFLIDLVASTYAVEKVKRSIKLKFITGDQTNEIKKLAGRAIAQLLTGKNYLERRVEKLQKDFEKRRAEYLKKQEETYKELKKKFENLKK